MASFSMQGVGGFNAVTMALDTTTIAAIGTDYAGTIGKAVALVGNDTVGFGTSGDAVFGVLTGVEADGLAGVQIRGFAVNVAADETTPPKVGESLAVDGAGGVLAIVTGTSRAICTSVDATASTATILM